jgi:hypothetical protein
VEHVAYITDIKNACSILARKPKAERSLGRPSCSRQEDSIKVDVSGRSKKNEMWMDLG